MKPERIEELRRRVIFDRECGLDVFDLEECLDEIERLRKEIKQMKRDEWWKDENRRSISHGDHTP